MLVGHGFFKEKMGGGGIHAKSVFVDNIPSKTSKISSHSSKVVESSICLKSISYDMVLFSSAAIVTSHTSSL